MKLYYIPTTRAVRPRWLLEEIGLDYELIYVTMEMTRQPEYRQLHPCGKVPVLVDEGLIIYESAAICAYLADQYSQQNLAPKIGTPERGYYYQWLFYATATLEPPVEKFMFNLMPNLPEKILPREKPSSLIAEESLHWFNTVAKPIEDALNDQDYLINNQLTTADIIVGGVLVWAYQLGMLTPNSRLESYVKNLMQRPAFIRANEQFS